MIVDELVLTRLCIRQVEKQDLHALEWDGAYKHFRNLYADAFRGVERGEVVMWLAELPEERVIGQAFVSLTSNRPELADGNHRAYVYGFRIRPKYQGLGVGTRLMYIIEEDLQQRGFRYVTLNVARDNLDARRLYERLGYRVTAAEPGDWSYVDENGIRHSVHEPAWRMEKFICRVDDI